MIGLPVAHRGVASHFDVILSEAKESWPDACPLRFAQGDSY
jgi:hypothetical protein